MGGNCESRGKAGFIGLGSTVSSGLKNEEVFPMDCQKAFEMGVRLTEKKKVETEGI